MDFVLRMLFAAVAVIAIGIALWFSLTLFALLFILAAGAVGFYALRNFLIAKDILNPRPGVPMDTPQSTVTIIEGDYERITQEEKK